MSGGFEFPKGEQAAEEEVVKETSEPSINQIETGLKFDDAELESIYDSIMFEGSYSEEVSIGKRVRVTFRTRTGKEAREVIMRLDKLGLNMGLTVESIRGLYSLAQSVLSINGQDLSGDKFEVKVEKLEELPTQLIARLLAEFSKFELKVAAAISHGDENF